MNHLIVTAKFFQEACNYYFKTQKHVKRNNSIYKYTKAIQGQGLHPVIQ